MDFRKILMDKAYRTNHFYAITISPPKYNGNPTYAYNDQLYYIRRWMNKFSNHWLLYPEFDLNSRLHWHGVVQIHDKTKFHKTRHQFQKMVGFVKVDVLVTAMDHIRFLQYCKKEYGQCYLEVVWYQKLKRNRTKYCDMPELDEGILKWCKASDTKSGESNS